MKLNKLSGWERATRSLLMWECGLKLPVRVKANPNTQSLLMWECGLKHDEIAAEIPKDGVTPYVGVWIETFYPYEFTGKYGVTPYVGVWIETIRKADHWGGR